MKVIIAGSRHVTNYTDVENAISESGFLISVVVSGGCRGVDALGERWAKTHGVPIEQYIPDWKAHGAYAGPLRNKEMAKNAEALIAIWDRESRGTKNMIEEAKQAGLEVYVHYV